MQISFNDVTRYRRPQEELERSKNALERAYEELQASNEELETTNEELQSTNEELETTNTELRMRATSSTRPKRFWRRSCRGSRWRCKLQVLAWNHRAEDLWGLRASEVQGAIS